MHKLTLVISFTVHYNDDVLVPFIESIREKLGWTKGQPVPDYLRCCSWFDGDIGQLQTMLFEAREAMDDFLNIVRNKHSAAATGTQQPCDLSPVFRLLKLMQKNTTATDKTSVGLREDLEELFSVYLKNCGLNLNIRKRKALMDFLLCLPDNLEAVLKEKHIKKSFVEAGMIDEKTGMMPVFDKLIGTCKRWVSADKKIGIPKVEKDQCREQFQHALSPCLVWLAWRLRSHPMVLEIPPEPILIAPTVPEFNVVYAGPATTKPASDFFKDIVWVENWKRIVKGVGSIPITDELMGKADSLALSMAARLDLHIDDRVDKSRHSHWTLQFTRDNLPPMAAAMCLAGHIVDEIETYDISECLLKQPTDEIFQVASGNLGKLEGCYLHNDPKKLKWIRSGKSSGDGENANFDGRGAKHRKNAASLDEMRLHQFYRWYPVEGVENLGARRGYFDNLVMYVAMAYDTSVNYMDFNNIIQPGMPRRTKGRDGIDHSYKE